MNYAGFISKLVEIFLWICAGYIARKTGVVDDVSNNRLSKFIVNIGNPMTLLGAALTAQISLSNAELLGAVAISMPWTILMAGTAYGCTFLLGRKVENRGIYAYLMTFGNVGIFGLPILAPLFGDEGLALGSMINAGFCVMIMTLGYWMISGGKATRREMMKQFLSFPTLVFLSLPVWYLLRLDYPLFLQNTVTGLGNTTLPLLMITVGNSLASRSLKSVFCRPRLILVSLMKLLLLPVLLTPVFRLLIPDDLLAGILSLCTGMPAGGLAVSLSILYHGDGEEAGTVVFLTTLFSLVTIPLLVGLLW